ncbi:hypothetical protein LAT59_02830 [Candidatus Gracilibacteria bacterium]|nr:hypothetical protein [Candidatus Gracilibacteria bacterium]
MTVTHTNILEKKKHNRYVLAIAFFLICIFLSGGLYIYSRSIESDKRSIQTSLQGVKQSIRERESDPLIQSYVLYERNKDIFSRLEQESGVPEFVSHIKMTALKYGLEMRGFSYSAGKLQTQVRSDNDSRGFGYEKVVNFINGYREDSEALFKLGGIQSFSGHDRIEYTISFQLRDMKELGARASMIEDDEVLESNQITPLTPTIIDSEEASQEPNDTDTSEDIN